MSRHDKELQTRWDADTTASVVDALLSARPTSPYGTHEGRVDLRGLTIEEPARVRVDDAFSRITKLYKFGRVTVRGIDFSHARLPEWRLHETTFEDCLFDHATLSSFRAYSATFTRCSFGSADLKDASLGARVKDRKPGGLYQDCDFSGADLRRANTDPGHFLRCNFQRTKWAKTRFLSTVLEACDFRDATIDSAFFDGRAFRDNAPIGLGENKLNECNFSTAKLRDTSFLAIDFRNCIPPAGDDVALVEQYPRRLEDALSYLKTLSSPDARVALAVLEQSAKSDRFLPADALGLLQLSHYPGDARALIAKAFGLPNN
jgi:uncharacterized protein YjbI with pentapeptide repeats